MTQLADEAFERIYSNIDNGLLKGTSSANQATVPQGYRLIIEYVSGFIFRPPSSALNSETTMAVTDPALGLNGAGFHIFPAIKTRENLCERSKPFGPSAVSDHASHRGTNGRFWERVRGRLQAAAKIGSIQEGPVRQSRRTPEEKQSCPGRCGRYSQRNVSRERDRFHLNGSERPIQSLERQKCLNSRVIGLLRLVLLC